MAGSGAWVLQPSFNGRLLRLSEDLRRRVDRLAALGTEAPTAAAPLIDEALAGLADGQIDADRAWLELHGRLRAASALDPQPPGELRADLYHSCVKPSLVVNDARLAPHAGNQSTCNRR